MFYVTPVPGSWSGPYIVNIGSDVHLNGNVTPGSWVLGNVTPGGVCMMNASFGCYGIPAMYDIQPRPAGLGTS